MNEIKRKAKKIMIIEAKTSLNHEAIGQIIVYKYIYLFPKVWGFPTVDAAILCKESTKTLEEVCRANNLFVFKI